MHDIRELLDRLTIPRQWQPPLAIAAVLLLLLILCGGLLNTFDRQPPTPAATAATRPAPPIGHALPMNIRDLPFESGNNENPAPQPLERPWELTPDQRRIFELGRDMLIEAAASSKGTIRSAELMGKGLRVSVGQRVFCDSDDRPRVAADCRAAVKILDSAGLIEPAPTLNSSRFVDSQIWRVTAAGYSAAQEFTRPAAR